MKYFISYSEIFLNDDQTKREIVRLKAYNLAIKFLTRKQIPGNYIVQELNNMKSYLESKEFTDTYFLSPYILNENQLDKDIMKLIVSSGETNTFNSLLNELKNEINQIKAGVLLTPNKYVLVNSADEYLSLYLANPHGNIIYELNNDNEKKILDENIQQGINKGNIYLTILYFKIELNEITNFQDFDLLYSNALKMLNKFNNADAYLILAKICENKFNRDKNKYIQAFNYYKKASELGSPCGQFLLGFSYFKGQGCQKDVNKALEYYNLSAKQNYVDALTGLGVYYLVNNDKVKAKEYLLQAAKQNDYKAMLLLDTDFERK